MLSLKEKKQNQKNPINTTIKIIKTKKKKQFGQHMLVDAPTKILNNSFFGIFSNGIYKNIKSHHPKLNKSFIIFFTWMEY